MIEYLSIRLLATRWKCITDPTQPAPRHILAVESFGVGDVVCALPAVRALKQVYPNAVLTFLTNRTVLQFCEGLPFLDHCEVCPRTWRQVWQFLKRWRPSRHDTLAVLLNDGWWQNVCVHLLNPRWLCGYRYRPRLDSRYHPLRLVTASWDESWQNIVEPKAHLVVRSLRAIQPIVGDVMDAQVSPIPDIAALAQATLPDNVQVEIMEHPCFVVVHPGTRGASKRWPMDKWKVLLSQITENMAIFMTGGPDEVEENNTLVTECPRVYNLTGQLTLAQEGNLMHQALCFIGPDCGPSHLASAVGCPTLILMGPTAPQTSSPYWPPTSCIHKPEGMDCIKVEEVIAEFTSLIRG